MEVILKQDVPTLGYKGDVVKVKPGYARNFLIPNAMCVVASENNRKIAAENARQGVNKTAKVKADAQAIADKLNETTLKISARTGTSGKIFGSITTLQIAAALKEQGYDIDRRKISLIEEIKNIGSYHASIDLHKEIKATLNLEIVAQEA